MKVIRWLALPAVVTSLLLPTNATAAPVPPALAKQARYVALHGGVLGTHIDQATPLMKNLVIKVLLARFSDTPDKGRLAVCVAKYESGWNPGAISATGDYGVGQINKVTWDGTFSWKQWNGFRYRIFDPEYNSMAMYNISTHGTDWSPWTVYRNGSC